MNHTTTSEGGMRRRDFLILGSVATVGVATSVSAGATSPLSVLRTPNPFLSIGFAAAEQESIAAADRLRAGFSANEARIRIHGLWRADARRNANRVDVSAFYAAGETSVPYLAWSHSAAATSPSVGFTVPVDESGHVALGIEQRPAPSVLRQPTRVFGRFFGVRPAADLPRQEQLVAGRSLCRLGTAAGDGLKLRRGTYFVALLQDGDRKPRWSAISARPVENGQEGLLRRGDAPVDFDYLVLSVDHA
jgi:hypothetical protein